MPHRDLDPAPESCHLTPGHSSGCHGAPGENRTGTHLWFGSLYTDASCHAAPTSLRGEDFGRSARARVLRCPGLQPRWFRLYRLGWKHCVESNVSLAPLTARVIVRNAR
ncbi:hypothetical protein HPB50_028832 [Hyalomma asiaticum]|nr:hypothetical protein HPB50_028832 [Hyalomma asiaticum]